MPLFFCHLLREISTVSTRLQSSLNSPQLLVQMRAGKDARTELLKLRSLCPLSASCQDFGLVMDTSRSNMLRVDMLIWGFYRIFHYKPPVLGYHLKKRNAHILQHLYALDNVPWPFAWKISQVE